MRRPYRFPLCLAAMCLTTVASGFEAGERWSCITDQGAEGFLFVHGTEDEWVIYSWGKRDKGSTRLETLCRHRDALSLEEIREFCKRQNDSSDPTHAALETICGDD